MARYEMSEADREKLAQPTNESCPDCERDLIWKSGKFGVFKACSGFPRCKWKASGGKEPVPKGAKEEVGEKCRMSTGIDGISHYCNRTHRPSSAGNFIIHASDTTMWFWFGANRHAKPLVDRCEWGGYECSAASRNGWACTLREDHDGDHWATGDNFGYVCVDGNKKPAIWSQIDESKCQSEHSIFGECELPKDHGGEHSRANRRWCPGHMDCCGQSDPVHGHDQSCQLIAKHKGNHEYGHNSWSRNKNDTCQPEHEETKVPQTPETKPVPPTDAGAALWQMIKTSAMEEIAAGTAVVIKDIIATMPSKALVIEWKDGDKIKAKAEGVYHKALPEVMDLFKAGLKNVMLVGPAGSGKTTLASDLAKALKLPTCVTVSCTAGMPEWHLTGRSTPNLAGGPSRYSISPMVTAYEGGGIGLCDEMDAADANTLITLNSAMANGHWALPHREENPKAIRHPDFYWMAGMNTYGTGADMKYVGRNQLDGATLDRFCCAIVEMDYDRDLETNIACAYLGVQDGNKLLSKVWQVRETVQKLGFRRTVGTRAVENMSKLLKSGKDMKYAMAKLTTGWTDDEKSKVK